MQNVNKIILHVIKKLGRSASLLFYDCEETMKSIFNYLDKKTKWLVITGSLANSFAALGQPFVLSKALDLKEKIFDFNVILQFTIYGFSVYMTLYALMLFANHTTNVFRREIHKNMRLALFKKLLVNKRFTDDEKISILTQDMEYLGDNYLICFVTMLTWGILCLVTASYIILQDYVLGSMFVLFSIIRPIPQFILSHKLTDNGEKMNTDRGHLYTVVSDNIRGSQTIINNQVVGEAIGHFHQTHTTYQESLQKYAFTHNIIYFFNGFMLFLSQVVPLALGFYFTLQGNVVSVAKLIAMYIASNQLVNPIQTIMYNVASIQGSKPLADKIFSILNEEEMEGTAASKVIVANIEQLVVADVTKSYGSKTLFSQLSFTCKMGDKVLIRGASGSGKSTLFRVISQLDSPDNGEIFVKTRDGLTFNNFRGNISHITQSPFLFNDTIRYNLALGQSFSDEELLEVLEAVGLVDEMDHILDVMIVDNGTNISGGQRVRLEIARFLLRKKDILLADEVTASLDATNSQKVRDILLSLPILVLEIAHYVDDDSRYDKTIYLTK